MLSYLTHFDLTILNRLLASFADTQLNLYVGLCGCSGDNVVKVPCSKKPPEPFRGSR